jgi:hypothetical protein
VDPFQAAISIAALVVFYFAAAPMLQLARHIDPFAEATLKERKREVLEFVRHAVFAQPTKSKS